MGKRWMGIFTCTILLLITAHPAVMQANNPPSAPQVVTGQAIEDFYPDYLGIESGICRVAEGDFAWAVAQSSNDIIFYTVGEECEGPVSASRRAVENIEWEDAALLDDLPEITPEEPVEPYMFPDGGYFEYCAGIAANPVRGQAPAVDRPFRIVLQHTNLYSENYPDAIFATNEDEIDAVVCITDDVEVLSTCNYSGNNRVYPVERQRRIKHIQIVNYATGQIFAENTFSGDAPEQCPDRRNSTAPIQGSVPDGTTWAAWVVGQSYGVSDPVARTVVNASSMNARAEPNTQAAIVAQLAYETPVTLIGRNEAGDWVAALLPDGQTAWLYVSLLHVAACTPIEALPVAAGPAVAITPPLP